MKSQNREMLFVVGRQNGNRLHKYFNGSHVEAFWRRTSNRRTVVGSQFSVVILMTED